MSRTPVTSTNILALLSDHHVLSASQILEKLHNQKLPVNKTTVYRALEKLLSEGILCRQIFSNDTVVYELREHHHDHLVCESCGKVDAVECEQKVHNSVNGFTVHHHHLTMYGLCKNCTSH